MFLLKLWIAGFLKCLLQTNLRHLLHQTADQKEWYQHNRGSFHCHWSCPTHSKSLKFASKMAFGPVKLHGAVSKWCPYKAVGCYFLICALCISIQQMSKLILQPKNSLPCGLLHWHQHISEIVSSILKQRIAMIHGWGETSIAIDLPAIQGKGGGGVECDQISDIRPPKNIRYHTPQKANIRYLAFTKIRYLALKIRYKVPPFHPPPPPPHSVTPCDEGLFDYNYKHRYSNIQDHNLSFNCCDKIFQSIFYR